MSTIFNHDQHFDQFGKAAQTTVTAGGACYGFVATTGLVVTIAILILIYSAVSGSDMASATMNKLLIASVGVIGAGTLMGAIVGYAFGGLFRGITDMGKQTISIESS